MKMIIEGSARGSLNEYNDDNVWKFKLYDNLLGKLKRTYLRYIKLWLSSDSFYCLKIITQLKQSAVLSEANYILIV